MARKLRLEFAGACYHVFNRGNYRRALFAHDGATPAFERCLGETCTRFGWRIHAFVIMRNHFHLAVETPQPNLSLGMKFLQGTWANRFNRYRGEIGRPFQGRYKSSHVQPGHVLAQVSHYIHLNPVRAKLIRPSDLAAFRWSSLWWLPQANRPRWLVAETVLNAAGNLPDTMDGWRRYVEYLAVMAEESPVERALKFGVLTRSWAVGTSEFRLGLVEEMRRRGLNLECAARHGEIPGNRRQLREDVWEERLQSAAKALNVDLHRLGFQKRDRAKVRLAAFLKETTDVSNGWLATRLQMGTPASVGQAVASLQQRAESRALDQGET